MRAYKSFLQYFAAYWPLALETFILWHIQLKNYPLLNLLFLKIPQSKYLYTKNNRKNQNKMVSKEVPEDESFDAVEEDLEVDQDELFDGLESMTD